MEPGTRFGRVVVLGPSDRHYGELRLTATLCDCGNVALFHAAQLGTASECRDCAGKQRKALTSGQAFNRHLCSAVPHFMRRALRAGTLVRPDSCERCGAACKPFAHHEDYARIYDVRWLCAGCHSARHVEMRREGFDGQRTADAFDFEARRLELANTGCSARVST